MPLVWTISNVYGRLEEEKARMKALIEWRYAPETEKKFTGLGFKSEEIQLPLINSRLDEFTLTSSETGKTFRYSKMVAKGVAILNKFHRLIKKYSIADDDHIIYLDGDGQIHTNHVFNILGGLKTGPFVAGKRIGEQGIPESRIKQERFENSFVEEHFGVQLPDVQCGCWGVTGKHLKDIYPHLNAEGFEVELDVMICSLQKGVTPVFVDISVIPPSVPSTYRTGEDDERKLAYLMNRFKIGFPQLLEKSQQFAAKHGPLPSEYVTIFSSPIIKDIKF